MKNRSGDLGTGKRTWNLAESYDRDTAVVAIIATALVGRGSVVAESSPLMGCVLRYVSVKPIG